MNNRKSFICHNCNKNSSKTAPNYYAQVKRLGHALCTDCALLRNAKNTSNRLKKKYKNILKNTDTIIVLCIDCHRPKKMQKRSLRDGYLRCKSCAAKLNRKNNADLYDELAKKRLHNQQFRNKVSVGIHAISEEIRQKRSQHAHVIRWNNNRDNRKNDFIIKAKELFLDFYDYSLVDYYNHITPVKIICPDHGIFERTPKNHVLNGYGCPRCSEVKIISSGHSEIADYIKLIRPNFDLNHNVRDVIPPYELDIFIPEKHVAIEHHGIYWHSYNTSETILEKQLHKIKSDKALEAGINLIQIFETEWYLKKQIIKGILASKLGATDRVYARKCELKKLSHAEYKVFMDINHLQGSRPSSYRIGLYYDDKLLMAMGISKHPKYEYELIRLATKIGTTVVGGISKLLSYAQIDLGFNKILSYADRRYSNGNGYLSCGFELISTTTPNYYYTFGNKNQQLFSRQHFQKHKLHRRLDMFDPTLSESANMFANGYRRIWDAGHMKLLWECPKY